MMTLLTHAQYLLSIEMWTFQWSAILKLTFHLIKQISSTCLRYQVEMWQLILCDIIISWLNKKVDRYVEYLRLNREDDVWKRRTLCVDVGVQDTAKISNNRQREREKERERKYCIFVFVSLNFLLNKRK
ncbi:hypothetical protein LSH36_568g01000 [Paralvinella palmiformis]|uniref:Uncharacterized protein n=1 Tax=Paralvinella palmiformis TaxID=53620 RepID=A0AAD9J776_9ANNE|nr:hypothetical protein LSH36_568g01000 [Paralvinella palmiformis]